MGKDPARSGSKTENIIQQGKLRETGFEEAQKRRFAGVRGFTSFSADWAFFLLALGPRPIACSLFQQAAMGRGRKLGVRLQGAPPR